MSNSPSASQRLSRVGSVELDKVSKRFGGLCAMNGVAFTADRGEFVSLLGPSGCGKTTTLRVIAGFERPTEGQIYLGGTPVLDLPPWKRDIGVVFQSYALFPYLTSFENVAFGLKVRNHSKKEIVARVDEALAKVGLSGLGERYPRQMSGGQRQRVALARALVIEPRLLLLDEPLSNLDAKLRQEMRLELKRIQRESGITTVFVTHDQEEAFSLSDKVVLMNNGRIEQIGAPEEIWRRPASRFVADFIGVENLLSGTVVGKDEGRAIRLPSGRFLRPTTPMDCLSGPVVVAIRASDIHMVEDGAMKDRAAEGGAFDLIEGEIIDRDYHGDTFIYRVMTPVFDKPLIVRASSDRSLSGAVALTLSRDKMIALEND